jgi:hypothetical protein
MSFFLFIVILFFLFYFTLRRKKQIKKQDSLAIYQEIENDFEEDFERDSNGNLTIQGMTDLVEWYEDDLRSRRVLQSDEIKNFEEFK